MEEQHALPTHHIQPTKPAMKKKSLFSLIKKYPLQIILFFIVSITSGVLLANNEAKSTANWETFDSKEAGVSFKHPKLFKVIEDKGWRITAYLSEQHPENNVKILYSHADTTIDQPTIEEQFLASCQAKRVSEIAAQGGRIKVYEDSTCGNQVVENSVLVYADNGMTYDIGLFGEIDRAKLYQFLSTFNFHKQFVSDLPIPSHTQQQDKNMKRYTSERFGFTFEYPAYYEIAEQSADRISFGEKATDGFITYLTITHNPQSFKTYKECIYTDKTTIKNFETQVPCLSKLETKDTIMDTTLGGKRAKEFLIVQGAVDSDYRVVQTTEEPLIEVKMFVSGGGLDAIFNGIISSFKFSNSAIPTSKNAPDKNTTVCTMDAKICPDGTTVGRTGPKCEFTCPDGSISR